MVQGASGALVVVGGIAAAVALAWVVMLTLAAWRLARMPLRPAGTRIVDVAEIPDDEARILESERSGLEALGFRVALYAASDPVIERPDKRPLYSVLLRHDSGDVFATVNRHHQPEQGRRAVIAWATCLVDGRSHLTFDGYRHFIVGTFDGWTLHDDYLGGEALSLLRHRERIAATGVPAIDDAAEVQARMARMASELLGALKRDGWAVTDATGRTYLRASRAWRVVLGVLRGERRAARARRAGPEASARGESASAGVEGAAAGAPSIGGVGAPAPDLASAALDADVRAFTDQLSMQRSEPWSRRFKWIAAIGTALLFAAVGLSWWPWDFALMLLAVIALHEAGHYAAMKATGFRNLSVFFVPGLGGLAVGEKPTATPFEKLFVYLAGPMPGLLLAMKLLLVFGPHALELPDAARTFLILAFVVNYLNLLPLLPLDGGRVIEAVLVSRAPWLRLGFAVCGAAALTALAAWWRDPVLAVVAGLVALSMPLQWRAARVQSRIECRRGEEIDEPTAIRRVFGAMHARGMPPWTFATRAAVAKAVMPDLMGPVPERRHAVVGLAVYAACLLLPLAVVFVQMPWLAGLSRVSGWFGDRASVARLPADDVDDAGSCRRPYAEGVSTESKLARIDLLHVRERRFQFDQRR